MGTDGGTTGDDPDDSIGYFLAHRAEIVHREGHLTQLVLALGAVAAVVVGLFGLVTAIAASHDAATSSRIQRHGLRVQATVLSLRTSTRTFYTQGGRYSFGRTLTSYDTVMTVQLARTVDNRPTAAIYSKQQRPASRGQVVDVLLDPENPRVGELAGQPVAPAHYWIVLALLAVGMMAGGLWLGASLLLTRLRRRAAGPPA